MATPNEQVANFKLKRKIILIVGGVFALMATIMIASIVFLYDNLFGSTKSAEICSSILTFKNSLPAGWKYVNGAEFADYKILRLENPQKVVSVFIEQNANRAHKTLAQLCEQQPGQSKFRWTKDNEGDVKLGEGNARFIIENCQNNAEERIYAATANGGYVKIRILEPRKSHFEINLAHDLLDSIKALKEPQFAKFSGRIFVATERFSKRQVIRRDAIEIVDVDTKVPGKNCVQNLEQVVGKKPTVEIQPGQVFCRSQFEPVTTKALRANLIVTVADVLEGSVYDADSVAEKKVSEVTKAVPPDAVSGRERVVGWISRYGLQEGQIVSAHDVSAVTTDSDDYDEARKIEDMILGQTSR